PSPNRRRKPSLILRIDNLFWGNQLPPPPSGEGRLPPLSSAAYFDELLFTKLFRGCEYLFRTQPDSSSISARNRYSHRAGILIHITPERLFTCPGIRNTGVKVLDRKLPFARTGRIWPYV